jgi:hypothetical protein
MILFTLGWPASPQLWRLNTLGRLRLVDDAPPIHSSEAKAAIGAELDKLGLARFPAGGRDDCRAALIRPRETPTRPSRPRAGGGAELGRYRLESRGPNPDNPPRPASRARALTR